MIDVLIFLLPPFVACLTMIFIFGYLGIHVIEREIIFIDIALAQMAAVGATFSHVFFNFEEHSIMAYGFALGFTILAAFFYSHVGKKIKMIPQEAIIGVSYAIAAAAALFMLALDAGADVHMEHMLTGSILWANWSDILLCSIIYLFVGLFHILFRKKFIAISKEYKKSTLSTANSALWDFLFYVTMGTVITFSVKIAGVLVIFTLLIIPAVFAGLFFVSWKQRIILAWIIGFAATIAGLAFSYTMDFSCGPSVVMFLGIFLILGAVVQKIRAKKIIERPE